MAMFAIYKQQQMMLGLERQERLNFLLEMQSKDTTTCDNCYVTEYKTRGAGWVHY